MKKELVESINRIIPEYKKLGEEKSKGGKF